MKGIVKQHLYCVQRSLDKLPDSPSFLVETDAAQEMVPDAFHLIFGNLVGDDGETLIELHSISIDNLAIELTRYLYSEVGLARACGTYDGHQGLQRSARHGQRRASKVFQ
jgi:hypothetical protein